MISVKNLLVPALLAVMSLAAPAADLLTVKAVNKLQIARASQTIELSQAQLAPLGVTNLATIHVRDSAGKELLVQAVDTDYDDYHKPDMVIFQSDFAPGETKTFTVSAGAKIEYKPVDFRAHGRFVRERFDDYAWENDLIAHRTYGTALETWKGEPLTSSAIDIWSKRTSRMVIDEWYMVDNYHADGGDGADLYSAGASRGDGGNGFWAADKLWVLKNFVQSRTLANGPIRVMFELDFPSFDVNGIQVSETVRVTLDAGSQMDNYRVTYKPEKPGAELAMAIGLKKVKGEVAGFDDHLGALTIWQPVEKNSGMQGVAVVVDMKWLDKQVEDKLNNLLVMKVKPNNSITYWAGFAWDRAGKITTADAWKKYVAEFAQGAWTPIEVTVSAK
jgi:hypothetical protein